MDKQINRVRSITKNSLLQHKPKSKKQTSLVLTYHPQIKFVIRIAKKLQPILKSDPQLQHLFPVFSLIAYRQPPNFKRILPSNKNPQSHSGAFSCNTPKCQLCSHIRTKKIVTGSNRERSTVHVLRLMSFTCAFVYFVSKLSILEKLE